MVPLRQFLVLTFVFFLVITATIDATVWMDSSSAWVNPYSLSLALLGGPLCAFLTFLNPIWDLG